MGEVALTMSEWVSVRHPPDLGSGFYLVWTDNTGVEKCRWSEIRKRWMGGAWTQHITHWRPMLAPPEKAKTDADGIQDTDTEKKLMEDQHNQLRSLKVKLADVLEHEPADAGDEEENEVWKQANLLFELLDSFSEV